MKFSILLVSLFTLYTPTTTDSTDTVEAPSRFFEEHLRAISIHRPPTYNTVKVAVSVSADVKSVKRLNEHAQEIEVDVVLQEEWNDERLVDTYDNPTAIIWPLASASKMWKPSTTIEGAAQSKQLSEEAYGFVKFDPNGTVLYSHRHILTIPCPMNFERLPFDTQKCKFSIASRQMVEKLEYTWKDASSRAVEKGNTIPLFDIKNVTYGTEEIGVANGQDTGLYFTVELKREFSFYFTHLFTPFAILVNLSWFTFFVHPSKDTPRIVFLTLLMMTSMLLTAFVNSTLPATSYRKAIDTWTSSCGIFIFLAIIETIAAIHFHHAKIQKDEEEAKANDEEQLIPVKSGPAGRWKEREQKKGCALRCSNWFIARADKIDPVGKHIVIGLFQVFIVYYLIRWAFF